MGIHILGTGSYTPAFQVTNADMAKIVETNDEWIRTRTGIQSRHIADGEPTWYMGAQAASHAIEMAGIDPKDIGLIIDTTITPDFSTPSVSCLVQREIGAVQAACFDLNAACSGFVYGMETAHCFLKTNREMKYALVVANENLTRITNYSDRSSCILFGDGAAAAIVEYQEDRLYSSYLSADGTGAKFLYAHSALPQSPYMPEPLPRTTPSVSGRQNMMTALNLARKAGNIPCVRMDGKFISLPLRQWQILHRKQQKKSGLTSSSWTRLSPIRPTSVSLKLQ